MQVQCRGKEIQYGQSCETDSATCIEVDPTQARASAEAKAATGYFRPGDMHQALTFAGEGVRLCHTNTGDEGVHNYAEMMCIVDATLLDIPAADAEGKLALNAVVTRFIKGDEDANSFDNFDSQPGTGNPYAIEDHPNGDVWVCLPDGADRDLKTEGCISMLSVKDTSAEPTGYIFAPDGLSAYVAIQHSDDTGMPKGDDYGTDDLILITGFAPFAKLRRACAALGHGRSGRALSLRMSALSHDSGQSFTPRGLAFADPPQGFFMQTLPNTLPALFENADMGIPMPDGCRLSARVWMPLDAAENPVPAVLEYIPYRKRDGTLPRDELMHAYVARHGYACIRVDMRGSGDSEGLMQDEYTEQELADAVEVIGWLAKQPWCSGSVGMMGKSWGGFNCLQTAFLQPPALKAVVSVCATTDRFADDIHYKGGCLLGENFGWGAVMLSFSSRPADPALRADWREMWLARLNAEPWLAPRWAALQERSAYWKHGSVGEDYSRMAVPVLIWGGWADNYMNTVANLVENVPAPVKGIVGPWVHQYPHSAVPGPKVGFLQEAVRWWDRWLKDIPNGAEDDPAYRAYMLHSAPPDASAKHRAGHWVSERVWPSPRVHRQLLGLGDGTLGTACALQTKISTPQHLGMHSGEFFPMGLNAEMPGDQRHDDAMSVCFDAAPLTASLDILGAARLTLTLSSDQPLAFIVARLCDVAPDGASVRIAHGMLNLCHRAGAENPAPMQPGLSTGVTFLIDQMAYRLAPGHHLRVALSTTYWPFLWPSPKPVTLTLTAGQLDLPVHHGSSAEWSPPPAETAAAWKHAVLRLGNASRCIESDLITGKTALVIGDDGGDVENLTHGLCSGETMSERWEIDPADPLSARAVHIWEQRLSRADWSIKTIAHAEMTASATHLRMQARLTAWEGDGVIFEREWDEEVPRRFV